MTYFQPPLRIMKAAVGDMFEWYWEITDAWRSFRRSDFPPSSTPGSGFWGFGAPRKSIIVGKMSRSVASPVSTDPRFSPAGSAPPPKISGTRADASYMEFFHTWRCSMFISPWSLVKTTSASSQKPRALAASPTRPSKKSASAHMA